MMPIQPHNAVEESGYGEFDNCTDFVGFDGDFGDDSFI